MSSSCGAVVPGVPPSKAIINSDDAMVKRLLFLVKKADAALSAECRDPALINAVLARVTQHASSKRMYTELFDTLEGVDSFCSRHGVVGNEKELLVQMQVHKDIFVANAFLDFLCTSLFIAEVVFIMHHMFNAGLLTVFLGLLLITDSVISRIKLSSQLIGRSLSAWLFRMKLVVDPYDNSAVNPLSGKIQMKKWTEQSWQLFVHVLFASIEYNILAKETWYDEPATIWIPHPWRQAATMSQEIVFVYLAQLSIWVYTCIVHRFWDERRKDYFVMYMHHIITIMLVAGSFAAGYLRVGIIILYVHDVSDVFVDLLKMVNYLKLENRRGLFASEIAYFACIVSWVFWRLYKFPKTAIYASVVEAYRILGPQPRSSADSLLGLSMRDLPLYFEMNTLLIALLCLHIYWAHLFFMIGYTMLTNSAREASRREYEGDSDDETAPTKTKAIAARRGEASSRKPLLDTVASATTSSTAVASAVQMPPAVTTIAASSAPEPPPVQQHAGGRGSSGESIAVAQRAAPSRSGRRSASRSPTHAATDD